MIKSNLTSLLSLAAGATLAYVAIAYAAKGPRVEFEEVALGEQTTSIFPESKGKPIHLHGLQRFPELMQGWDSRGKRPVVVWLGNSQLHAINQAKATAEPASIRTFARFEHDNLDVLTFSVPNANLQEHYLLFEHLRVRMPIVALVLPVVFDDFRETGIRDALVVPLQDIDTRRELEESGTGRRLISMSADQSSGVGGAETDSQESPQEKSEAFLDGWMKNNSSLYAARDQIRGTMLLGLYRLRNKVFRISAQTVRNRIPGRYALNRDALIDTLAIANRAGIRMLVYVVPLRQDVQSPYDARQYAEFKEDIESISLLQGSEFADLDTLVPGEFWGTMADIQGDGAGLDFMHFQEEGHSLLADAISDRLRQIFSGTATK